MTPHRPPGSRRLFPLALALLGAVSVAAMPSADAAPPMGHPTRPIVDDARTFTYAELPLLETTRYAACSNVVLRIGPPPLTAADAMRTARRPDWKVEGLPTDSNLRVGNQHYVSAFPFSYGRLAQKDPAKNEAEWVVLDRGVTTQDRAPISRCTTAVKPETPLGADTVEKGFASALVPGRVYAYRRCVDGCEAPLGSESRIEELGVVTSPALWVSSSGWGSNGTPGEDAFSRGFAAVRPGTTATIVVGLPPTTASTAILRSPKATQDADTFDIEVMWPLGAEPSMTVFSGHVEGNATELAVRR